MSKSAVQMGTHPFPRIGGALTRKENVAPQQLLYNKEIHKKESSYLMSLVSGNWANQPNQKAR